MFTTVKCVSTSANSQLDWNCSSYMICGLINTTGIQHVVLTWTFKRNDLMYFDSHISVLTYTKHQHQHTPTYLLTVFLVFMICMCIMNLQMSMQFNIYANTWKIQEKQTWCALKLKQHTHTLFVKCESVPWRDSYGRRRWTWPWMSCKTWNEGYKWRELPLLHLNSTSIARLTLPFITGDFNKRQGLS